MKYLVKLIFETITETVDGVETTRETNVVSEYQVKYKTESRHKPRGGSYIFLETEDSLKNPIVTTDAEGDLILAEDPVKLLETNVEVRYNVMVEEIYAEMAQVFGTSNDASAAATAATYEAMSKRPASYVDIALGFANASEVKAYADAKLDEADAYGIFRLKRIAQYKAEKDAILNP
jgi:hypothetical protein